MVRLSPCEKTNPQVLSGIAQEGSQQNAVEDLEYDMSIVHVKPGRLVRTNQIPTESCKQDLELITAYLVKEKAPRLIQAAFAHISNVCTQRVVYAN